MVESNRDVLELLNNNIDKGIQVELDFLTDMLKEGMEEKGKTEVSETFTPTSLNTFLSSGRDSFRTVFNIENGKNLFSDIKCFTTKERERFHIIADDMIIDPEIENQFFPTSFEYIFGLLGVGSFIKKCMRRNLLSDHMIKHWKTNRKKIYNTKNGEVPELQQVINDHYKQLVRLRMGYNMNDFKQFVKDNDREKLMVTLGDNFGNRRLVEKMLQLDPELEIENGRNLRVIFGDEIVKINRDRSGRMWSAYDEKGELYKP